jgi:photosystem II stability/assembly factor-like uncharacterized protein
MAPITLILALIFALESYRDLPTSQSMAVRDRDAGGKYYAAVFLNRSQVSVGASGSIGLYRRGYGDTVWENIYRPNLFTFGIGMWSKGATKRLYIAGGNGLHRSENGGTSWRILTDWRTEEVLSVALDPVDSARLYIATTFGIFRSDDDGKSWHKKMKGMARTFVQKVIIDRSDRRMLYACCEDDLYLSKDGAEHWVSLHVGVPGMMMVAQHPDNPNHILVGTEDNGVRVSLDKGKSWHAGRGLPNSAVYSIAFSSDRQVVYAGGYETGLWRSSDSGLNWQPLWQSGELEAIFAIFVHPRNQKHLMVGTSGQGIYESFDEGKTWCRAGLSGCHVKQIELFP